jgi:hypothetical protein
MFFTENLRFPIIKEGVKSLEKPYLRITEIQVLPKIEGKMDQQRVSISALSLALQNKNKFLLLKGKKNERVATCLKQKITGKD